MSTIPTFQHVAVTVSDRERSLRFYTEALGFEADHTKAGNDDAFPELSRLLGVPGIDSVTEDLANGHQKLEMVFFRNPEARTSTGRAGHDQVGLSHLCFYVEDMAKAEEKIEECGGEIVSESKVAHDKPDGVAREYLMCTDPDGVRLLLYTGAPRLKV